MLARTDGYPQYPQPPRRNKRVPTTETTIGEAVIRLVLAGFFLFCAWSVYCIIPHPRDPSLDAYTFYIMVGFVMIAIIILGIAVYQYHKGTLG
ncbi:MAG: hypothetical protein WA021_02160 [Minisyncoccia bacterium]